MTKPAKKTTDDLLDFPVELLEHLTEEELEELDKLLFQELWVPLPGPQMEAESTLADITGYGGAAGGGKTDLACGLSIMNHRKSIIYRREGTQLLGITERITELLGTTSGYSSQKNIWRFTNNNVYRTIEFGGVPYETDKTKYQGRPHDLKVFDEATEFLESQVRFLMGWLRSADPKQRCRVLMTFNPPTSVEGRWVVYFFGPWLDKKHPNPAKPGELRWVTADPKTGEDVWVDGPDPVMLENAEGELEECKPLSRTFIPAKVEDNPYYMESGYKAVLQAMPEPLRSQMLKGDFMAGVEDDKWQVIPTAWAEAAMDRWKPKEEYFKKGEPIIMDSIGVDVACGVTHKTIIWPRYGTWFAKQVEYPGKLTADGQTCGGLVIAERRDRAVIHIDHAGIGHSAYDFLKENVQTVGVNNAEKSFGLSLEGSLKFANKRAELYWRMREALDPSNPIQIALPPDKELLADLTVVRWKLTPQGILIKPKDEIKKELGRSPDRADSACLALLDTVKQEMDPLIARNQYKAKTEYDPYSDERMGMNEYRRPDQVQYQSSSDYDPYK